MQGDDRGDEAKGTADEELAQRICRCHRRADDDDADEEVDRDADRQCDPHPRVFIQDSHNSFQSYALASQVSSGLADYNDQMSEDPEQEQG